MSCKHTLKLSFAQHCPSVLSLVCQWADGKNNVCVGVWKARRQSKQRPSATTSFWLKTCALTLNTHTLLISELQMIPVPDQRNEKPYRKASLIDSNEITLREKKFLSDMLCAFNQWSKTSMRTHFSSNHSGLLKTALFKIVYHSKRISRNLLIVNPVQFNQDYINLILVHKYDWKICIT